MVLKNCFSMFVFLSLFIWLCLFYFSISEEAGCIHNASTTHASSNSSTNQMTNIARAQAGSLSDLVSGFLKGKPDKIRKPDKE